MVQPADLIGTIRYKIGMSNKQKLDRLNSYNMGTRYLCIMEQLNVAELEKKIKVVFNLKFKLVSGRETFEGDETEIKYQFLSTVIQPEIFTRKYKTYK